MTLVKVDASICGYTSLVKVDDILVGYTTLFKVDATFRGYNLLTQLLQFVLTFCCSELMLPFVVTIHGSKVDATLRGYICMA